ncbi:MAG: hypothetical protein C3F11_14680 [Methylocystaceae bacterium]|nr:MAG: hypothetical protein C3F11_14680 [Methylocystaceae bacterium]
MVSRRRHSLTLRSSFAALAAIGLALGASAARAAGWQYYDPECPIALGPSKTMKFVTMQPKKSIERICDALPEAGPSVIALDAPDPELREMNWDIRVLHDVDGADGEMVFRLPTEKHRNGMVNFDHDFAAAGKYVLLARLTSDDGAKEYVGRHRFTVGLLNNKELYGYVFFACFFVAIGAFVALRKRGEAKNAALTPPPQ